MEDGRVVTFDLVESIVEEVLGNLRSALGSKAWATCRFDAADEILKELSTGEFQEFLTTSAYSELEYGDLHGEVRRLEDAPGSSSR